MARFYKAQVSLSNDTALPRDLAVNTYHFRCDGVGTVPDEATDIDQALINFYSVIDQWLSANLATTNAMRVKIYNHEDAPPRVPVLDTTHTITPASSALPNETAICLSYKASPTSGVRRQRSSGRIYLGPVGANTMVDSTGDMFIESSVLTSIADAAHDNLLSFVGAESASEFFWSVFSRSDALGLAVGAAGPSTEPTYSNAELDDGYHTASTCYVDNAFDTQRRRGLPAQTRTVGA